MLARPRSALRRRSRGDARKHAGIDTTSSLWKALRAATASDVSNDLGDTARLVTSEWQPRFRWARDVESVTVWESEIPICVQRWRDRGWR